MTDEVKNAVVEMASAFEEFKATNDQRLKQIEEKGSADPVVEEKLKNTLTSMLFFCNRGDTKYHGGLRSRELCQAPCYRVPLTPRQALLSHPRPCYVFLYGRTD